MSRAELHNYWLHPDADNEPEGYLQPEERSEFLFEIVRAYAEPDASVLEIGCNVGRNLAFLQDNGYSRLAGIEINPSALEILARRFPELKAAARIENAAVEIALPRLADSEYDLIFTMAVLEHLHPDSEWVFGEIARVGRTLLTIEDESSIHWRAFPRDYRRIFERLGMTQVEERSCAGVPGLGEPFVARVFRPRG